jgi:aldose 1-epimerase
MSATRIEETTFEGYDAFLLAAGVVEAIFLPDLGMLCPSLRVAGDEVLGRTDELRNYVERGSTIGIPLLHPWANRLGAYLYTAVGRTTVVDRKSTMLHYDENGLPMHGVPGAKLEWEVTEEDVDEHVATLSARLPWMRGEPLEIFPFPHLLEMDASVDEGGLTIETTLTPQGDIAVPIAFGFHPYFSLPEAPREQWRLELAPLRRLELDRRAIPTGIEQLFTWRDAPLGDHVFDDAFRLAHQRSRFTVSTGKRHVTVAFLEGFTHAQIYAPRDKQYIAIEPMTAPPNALVSNLGLRTVEPRSSFRASFRIEL